VAVPSIKFSGIATIEMSLGVVPVTQARKTFANQNNPGISANPATICATGDLGSLHRKLTERASSVGGIVELRFVHILCRKFIKGTHIVEVFHVHSRHGNTGEPNSCLGQHEFGGGTFYNLCFVFLLLLLGGN
jgi:hypothetical protein